jgi:hypothetical protein
LEDRRYRNGGHHGKDQDRLWIFQRLRGVTHQQDEPQQELEKTDEQMVRGLWLRLWRKLTMRVVWEPQPRQREFMRRGEYEAFFGGAAGGGKSDCLVIEALRQVNVPNYKALILRKTYDSLKELIEKSLYYYPQAFPKARYNGSSLTWTFPSGAKIRFGNVQAKNYKTKYQGQQYDLIAFDELTHFTWEEYSWFFSRNRPSGPGTVCYIRATGNPGGIGHAWVKSRFISAMKAGETITEKTEIEGPGGQKFSFDRSRIFIPSSVFDNQILLENDPNYLAALDALPWAERQALMMGNWDSFIGQVFTEWKNDPAHYKDQRWTHVIEPFQIPKHWEIVRSFDWGHAKPFSVGWWAVDEDGRMFRIRELYGCRPGQPNTGVEWPDQKIAQEILRIEKDDPNIRGHSILGVADWINFFSSEKRRFPPDRCQRIRALYFPPISSSVAETGQRSVCCIGMPP